QRTVDATDNSLERIKRQLATGSGRNLLQGPLYKRSETLRKWNERWVILDPTTGKMEYKTRRNEPAIKGTILFDENSTITVSPVNFQGLPKYNGCCICILVSKYIVGKFIILVPHRRKITSCVQRLLVQLKLGLLPYSNATQLVLKAHKEAVDSLSGSGSSTLGTVATVVAAANSTALECSKEIQAAMQVSLRNALKITANKPIDGPLDDLTIMKLKELEEKTSTLSREKDQLVKERDSALKEAHLWRSELGKARERVVILEGAVVRAEEKARVAEASGEAKAKEASQREAAAWAEKQELLAYVNMLQTQLQSVSKTASMPGENAVHMSEDQVVNAQAPVGENEWNDIQATEAGVSDVREISAETERDSLDITVVTPESDVPRNDLPPESFHHQP
ncbi:hypothetical protein HID58_062623, partial [Brassica napus]